jgi:predicted nucleic acid-binding protein
MMVLVDTSVWIRFLRGAKPYAASLDALLEANEVVAHELVHGELLIGERGGRAELLRVYGQIEQAPVVPHADVVAFVRARHLQGRGLSWIDAHLLASAIVGRLSLWTADTTLAAVATELNVGAR